MLGLRESLKAGILLGRPAKPGEEAGSVVRVTYPETDYVSGQLLATGGGYQG